MLSDDDRLLNEVLKSKRILLYRLRNEIKGFDDLDEEEQATILLNLRSNQFNPFRDRLTCKQSYILEKYTRALREILEELTSSTRL